MEVPLPEVQSRFNFSDPEQLAKELEENQNGSYFHKLNEFLNSERLRLHERFIYFARILNENLDAYEQVWAASSGLITRSLEFFWFHRFEWDDIEREALELEAMEVELEQTFSDFKREMDSLSVSTLHLSSCLMAIQKIMDMQGLLKGMVLKIYPLFKRDFGTVSRKFELFKCDATMDLSDKYDERIAGRLRWAILRRQMDVITDNFREQHKASVRLVRDILPMGTLISRWNNWLRTEALKFTELVANPDLKVGQEVVNLLEGPCYEMLLAIIPPPEYYSVFEHPNRGKIPIDMR